MEISGRPGEWGKSCFPGNRYFADKQAVADERLRGTEQGRKSGFTEETDMWICPKCGREFKRTNQGHYCGKAPGTVLEYIDSQPMVTRPRLMEMMVLLQNSVPCVKERISWSMPYYEKEGKSISFSACKKHISFYAGAEAIGKFALELNEFATNKNAIYFPYDKALPAELIENIARWCLS